nr:immunoglobulin heavy chain junction region [Macaca mulatta]MOY18820.1 immunoglobulin heavy chain junction region [Macaca mulatta]MOY19047.1 immunoglobulin heavy chain junction region [Macaca mulatta]MOY20402.1 immunoglobulin heavy chain junction region [Macaca mulatta]MOY20504.1 immunoglobulin heavy chain junction region [Macaca mulatta]
CAKGRYVGSPRWLDYW